MSDMAEGAAVTAEQEIPARVEFNPFQTFSYPGYVATVMDAHFDPYAEGLRQPGRSKQDMEAIPRMMVPPAGEDN